MITQKKTMTIRRGCNEEQMEQRSVRMRKNRTKRDPVEG